MTTTAQAYTTARIAGGVAVYLGPAGSPAYAVRIFATTAEAREWVAARPC